MGGELPLSSNYVLGGDLVVRRLGYGAMRIVGQPRNFGQPADRQGSLAALRAAVDHGATLIDTAESYGPGVSEELIAEALHPYPADLVIATKGGITKVSATDIRVDGSPEALRRSVEASLRRLRVERVDLYQLHRPDPAVAFERSIGALADLRSEGKIRHVGLSNVNAGQLRAAQGIVPIVSVQNRYSLVDRGDDEMVDLTAVGGIAFLSYGPLGADALRPGSPIANLSDHPVALVAARHEATPAQIALAWLLHRAENVIPIPGSTNVAHVADNAGALAIQLTGDDLDLLGGS